MPLFLFFASIFSFKLESAAVRRLNKIISFAPHVNDQPLHYRCIELRMHPVFKRHTHLQILLRIRQRLELFIGRLYILISITPLLPTPLIHLHLCKQARSVIIHIPVQMQLMELVQLRRTLPRNMCVSEQFPQHMAILAFDQRIVVAMPGSGFGKFNAKFFQQFSHPIVHIFGTVVAVHVITSLNSPEVTE